MTLLINMVVKLLWCDKIWYLSVLLFVVYVLIFTNQEINNFQTYSHVPNFAFRGQPLIAWGLGQKAAGPFFLFDLKRKLPRMGLHSVH